MDTVLASTTCCATVLPDILGFGVQRLGLRVLHDLQYLNLGNEWGVVVCEGHAGVLVSTARVI